MFDTELENLERVNTENSNDDDESLSELQELFCYVPQKDWSNATNEEVAIAAKEAKEWLGM